MNHKMTNFHMHTSRCHHAYASDEDFVLTSIQNGFEVIGFSDHSCWKYDSDFIPHMRMRVEDFDDYKKSVLALKEKYKDQVEIHLGMEAEYYPDMQDWLLQFCVDEEIEYLIFGNHFYKSDELGIYFGNVNPRYVQAYFDTCIEGLKTGMYSYLAHPELILRNEYLRWNSEIEAQFTRICKLCKKLDIPLEYNVLGMQMNQKLGYLSYPHPRFWRLAGKYGCKAIIGMDAHCKRDLDRRLYEQAYEDLEAYGVEIVNEIKHVDFKKLLESKKRA